MTDDDSKSNEFERPSKVVAYFFTFVSLLLSLGPGIIAWIYNTPSRYDAGLAILTATLIAVIWYTQYTYESLQHSRNRDEITRRRARKSLATGLLAEIQWLDRLLRDICKHGPWSLYDPFAHPLLSRSLLETSLFEPHTVVLLARFHALIQNIQDGVNLFNSDPEEIFGRKGTENYYEDRKTYRGNLKAQAYLAVTEIRTLAEALQEEGGTLPELDRPEVVGEQLPELPPSPFTPRRLPE